MSLFYTDQKLRAPHLDSLIWTPRRYEPRHTMALGEGTIEGRYALLGDNSCWYSVMVTFMTSTVNALPQIGLPFPAVNDGIAPATFHEAGVHIYGGDHRWVAGDTLGYLSCNLGNANGNVTNALPAAWGDDDFWIITGRYQVDV